MQEWIKGNKDLLLKIANEYEQYNRQTYHFMYDLVCLFKNIESHSELRVLLQEIRSGPELFHNRIQAELYHFYEINNVPVELFPVLEGSLRKPDLNVDGILLDVKTILITSGADKDKFLREFVKKLRRDILDKERKKRQVGQNGSLFVAIWSNLLSSLLYVKFNKAGSGAYFTKSIPRVKNDQVLFVIPSFVAFDNYYLVFDRKTVARNMDKLTAVGFRNLIREKDMAHAVITNVREGCTFGQMAKDLRIMFRFL